MQTTNNRQSQPKPKTGIIAALLRPLGYAIALLFMTYMTTTIAFNFIRGLERDRDYRKNYHIDKSHIELFQSSFQYFWNFLVFPIQIPKWVRAFVF